MDAITNPILVQRREQMNPVLTDAQIQRIANLGKRREVGAGELLYDESSLRVPFIVVLSGLIEITLPMDGREQMIIEYTAGGFTGEVNMLDGRRVIVRARMKEAGAVLVVDREQLHLLIQRDAELSEILMRAFILRRMALIAQGGGDVILIGSRFSASTLTLKEFLSRNGQPFTYHEVESDPAVEGMLERFQVAVNEVPVILCRGGHLFRNPTVADLAEHLGLTANLDPAALRDVVVIGAGPAGLAAAVYAASEGLNVLVLESTAPGGQAGQSSRIENYLGFPTGISGEALAGRALAQAEKFGAEVAIARTAVRIECDAHPYRVHLGDGSVVRTKALVIATGVRYRRPELPDLHRYEGMGGVMYSATHLEAQVCAGEMVAVVGGGNSAGQAAVFLAGVARQAHVLVRGPGLAESMSRYLIQRIEDTKNITLHTRTQIEAFEGDRSLERVRLRHTGDATETLPIRHVFMMTGADPNTGWLTGCLALDAKGFIKTGPELTPEDLAGWHAGRSPMLLETSIPGVFATGDVRSNSVKRVASAVGEGSICVQMVHAALREL